MYDGDADNRSRPDIGAVFGRVVELLRAHRALAAAIAVQRTGWYSPSVPGGPICSATGTPYQTFVFDDELPGEHATLTQSTLLLAYPLYQQIVVGPAGPIATEQLQALNRAVVALGRSPVPVTVIKTSSNHEVQAEMEARLDAASDGRVRGRLITQLEYRRQQPYGALFTATGRFALNQRDYPGISFRIVE